MSDVALLTNHAEALLCVAKTPGARIRDIAECIGVTERAAHRIICELEAAGFVTRHRVGRRNFYEVHPDIPIGQTTDTDVKVSDLLRALLPPQGAEAA